MTTPVPDEAPGGSGTDARAKIADFQQQIYAIQDGRVVHNDNQASILVAAAVAVASVAAGSATLEEGTARLLFALVGCMAALTAILALYGRREAPRWVYRNSNTDMSTKREVARVAVAEVYDGSDADIAARLFAAWHAMSESVDRRSKQKLAIYSSAAGSLVLEVLLLLILLLL